MHSSKSSVVAGSKDHTDVTNDFEQFTCQAWTADLEDLPMGFNLKLINPLPTETAPSDTPCVQPGYTYSVKLHIEECFDMLDHLRKNKEPKLVVDALIP